jgi:hypothetical protein
MVRTITPATSLDRTGKLSVEACNIRNKLQYPRVDRRGLMQLF